MCGRDAGDRAGVAVRHSIHPAQQDLFSPFPSSAGVPDRIGNFTRRRVHGGIFSKPELAHGGLGSIRTDADLFGCVSICPMRSAQSLVRLLVRPRHVHAAVQRVGRRAVVRRNAPQCRSPRRNRRGKILFDLYDFCREFHAARRSGGPGPEFRPARRLRHVSEWPVQRNLSE